MSFQTAIQLFGGVGIFLFAIKLISDSLQLLAGDRLRQLIGALTKTPALGVLIGASATILIQSSSATTVMTVSFVDAGLMTLKQAIGVIMGANIGTTITGQIIAIKVKDFAYLFVIIGVLLSFFAKTKNYTYLGNGLLGFGLLFVGMQTMESSMSFLRDRQDIFIVFSKTPLMGVLAGTILTLLVQSSSATVGLTIALGTQGLLPLDAAIAIIMGDNIGTTITAIIASIGTNRIAKQACAAHFLFNVIGVCIFLPLMPLYIGFLSATSSSIGHQIANAHTLFNICNTLLFLPFVTPFAKLINKLIPVPTQDLSKETLFLDPKLIEVTPVMGIEAIKNECIYIGKLAIEQMENTKQLFFNKQPEYIEIIINTDLKLDKLHRAILTYSESILRAGISDDASLVLKDYTLCAGYLERISDYCKRMITFYEYKKNQQSDFSLEAINELKTMFNIASKSVNIAVDSFNNTNLKINYLNEVETIASSVRNLEAELRISHLNRLGQGICNPETGLIFVDVVSTIEHIAYRAKKIVKLASNIKHSAK